MVSFTCIQTVSLPRQQRSISLTAIVVPNEALPRLVVATNTLQCWLLISTADAVQDEPQSAILFSPHFLRFVSTSGRSLRVWEAKTGRLVQCLNDVCASHITAIAFDATERTCFLGEHSGSISQLNLSAGQIFRRLPKHQGELIAIGLVSDVSAGGSRSAGDGGTVRGSKLQRKGTLLVSIGCDQHLHVCSADEGTLVFDMRMVASTREDELTSLCTSADTHALIAVGTSHGAIQVPHLLRAIDYHTHYALVTSDLPHLLRASD
jgi:WD40 repeat protein